VSANDFVEARLGLEPKRLSARRVEAPGQPATIPMMAGSGSRRMRATTPSPAMRLKASICSATVTDTLGIVRLRRGPISPPSMVAARSRKLTAERGVA
jgi:hypothetical protein